MPAKFEDDLIWVSADAPLSDSAFLSDKIKDLCEDLPIFWLRPTYSSSKPTVCSLRRNRNVITLNKDDTSQMMSHSDRNWIGGGGGKNQ